MATSPRCMSPPPPTYSFLDNPNLEYVPDTWSSTVQFGHFMMTILSCTPPPHQHLIQGPSFFGSKGQLMVNRAGYIVVPISEYQPYMTTLGGRNRIDIPVPPPQPRTPPPAAAGAQAGRGGAAAADSPARVEEARRDRPSSPRSSSSRTSAGWKGSTRTPMWRIGWIASNPDRSRSLTCRSYLTPIWLASCPHSP